MQRSRILAVYILYLATSVPIFGWYERAAVSALLNPSRDVVGNIVFAAGGVVVYPFTVVAALVGVAGTAYRVFRCVGGFGGLLLGLAAGRAATLAMFEAYELTFTGLGATFHGWDAFEKHYLPQLEWSLLKLSYVGVLTPWLTADSAKKAAATLTAAAAAFALWLATGYNLPDTGNTAAYILNAATRILYAATPIMLVGRNNMSQPVKTG
jgi:hypothetical protein